MIFGLFGRRSHSPGVRAIYAAIVAQARQPAFYVRMGVPDTAEGRYDMLVLHAFLYMHRLKNEAEPAKQVAQQVFDLMFEDMDRSLREMGVGDLAVPKRIKKMAQAFYGRTEAYDAGLQGDGPELAEALGRNSGGDGGALAAYTRLAVQALNAQSATALSTTGPIFPVPQKDAA